MVPTRHELILLSRRCPTLRGEGCARPAERSRFFRFFSVIFVTRTVIGAFFEVPAAGVAGTHSVFWDTHRRRQGEDTVWGTATCGKGRFAEGVSSCLVPTLHKHFEQTQLFLYPWRSCSINTAARFKARWSAATRVWEKRKHLILRGPTRIQLTQFLWAKILVSENNYLIMISSHRNWSKAFFYQNSLRLP